MTETQTDYTDMLEGLGKRAQVAARNLAAAPTYAKNQALLKSAEIIQAQRSHILSENAKDMETAEENGLTEAMLDRLVLDKSRVEAMAQGLKDVASLDDPIGTILSEITRPNGLVIQRKRVPLGVIGIIYESRPNVTADAGALCLKAGNAAILRGGSESFFSSAAILECLHEGLKQAGLPVDAVQRIPTRSRAAVGAMLRLCDYIDVIIPRGGKSLIARITEESKIPLFKHLEGICHSYVDKDADLEMAKDIVLNAKMRRTGVCGSTETLLIDKAVANKMLPSIIDGLINLGCEVRGDEQTQAIDYRVQKATAEDWDTEYLDSIISVRIVSGVGQAMEHIEAHSSSHTDAIITENSETAEEFLNSVDSAIVMVNASTQYADGGEFGMGAEIGISTGKLHARGPVGVDQLTSSKYVVRGNGQCRP
jgi:glutamate-5-semialdehyde dehydrogenase